MTNAAIARDEDGVFLDRTEAGHPLCHITADGDILCTECTNLHGHTEERCDGWRIIASAVNWSNHFLQCNHCGELIPAADARS